MNRFDKAKQNLADAKQKIQNSEGVSKTLEQAQNNEYADKAKSVASEVSTKVNKNSKLIKIGIAAVAILLLVGLGTTIFGNNESREATKYIEDIMTRTFESNGYTVNNVKSSVISSQKSVKNTSEGKYAIDLTITVVAGDGTKMTHDYYIPIWTHNSSGTPYSTLDTVNGSPRKISSYLEQMERYRYSKDDADAEDILAGILKHLGID